MDSSGTPWSLHHALPAPVHNLLLAAQGLRRRSIRYGSDFAHKLGFLRSTDDWDRSHIDTHQDDEVADLVDRAYRQTEYYRGVMDARRLKPRDIHGVADLPKLSILTGEDIRSNFDAFVSARVQPEDLIETQSGGTSGRPLRLLTTREAVGFKWAVRWRQRSWFGKKRGDLHLSVTTKPLVPPRRRRPPYWRWDRSERQAILPSGQIVPAKLAAILTFLDETPFEFFTGHSSILHSLARAAADRGLGLEHGPHVVFTTGTGLPERHRSDIAQFSGAQVAKACAFGDGAGSASSCPEGNLHEDFEFGRLECLDPTVDAETGVVGGRLLATGFATGAFPLIRYDVGIYGKWMPDDYRCPCGRQSRVLHSVERRSHAQTATADDGSGS